MQRAGFEFLHHALRSPLFIFPSVAKGTCESLPNRQTFHWQPLITLYQPLSILCWKSQQSNAIAWHTVCPRNVDSFIGCSSSCCSPSNDKGCSYRRHVLDSFSETSYHHNLCSLVGSYAMYIYVEAKRNAKEQNRSFVLSISTFHRLLSSAIPPFNFIPSAPQNI